MLNLMNNMEYRCSLSSLVMIPNTFRWWSQKFQADFRWWNLSFVMFFLVFPFNSYFANLSCIKFGDRENFDPTTAVTRTWRSANPTNSPKQPPHHHKPHPQPFPKNHQTHNLFLFSKPLPWIRNQPKTPICQQNKTTMPQNSNSVKPIPDQKKLSSPLGNVITSRGVSLECKVSNKISHTSLSNPNIRHKVNNQLEQTLFNKDASHFIIHSNNARQKLATYLPSTLPNQDVSSLSKPSY